MTTKNIDACIASVSSSDATTITDAIDSYTVSSPTYCDIAAGPASTVVRPSYISSGTISITDTYRQNIDELEEELDDIHKEMSDLKDYFDEKEITNDINTMNKANKVYKELKKNIVDLERTIDTLTSLAYDAIDKASLLETRLSGIEVIHEQKLDELYARMSAIEAEVQSK